MCVSSASCHTHTRLPAVVIPSTLHHCCTFCSTIAAPLMVSAVETQLLIAGKANSGFLPSEIKDLGISLGWLTKGAGPSGRPHASRKP